MSEILSFSFRPSSRHHKSDRNPQRNFKETMKGDEPDARRSRNEHDDRERDTRVSVGTSLDLEDGAEQSGEKYGHAERPETPAEQDNRHCSDSRTDCCSGEPFQGNWQ